MAIVLPVIIHTAKVQYPADAGVQIMSLRTIKFR